MIQTRVRGHGDLPMGDQIQLFAGSAQPHVRYKDWEGVGKDADAWLNHR
jgi:hypothetical protein